MIDFRQYWQEIRTIQSQLPDYVWMMSLEDAVSRLVGGCLVEVAADLAARLLHAKSHRLATEAEVASLRDKVAETKREAVHQGRRRRGIAIVEVK
jgi:hypothetical protein